MYFDNQHQMHCTSLYANCMNIRERLRKARKAKYPSAREAAESLGWVYPTYSSHENGSRGIPLEEIPKYARAFGVKREWLAFGIGDEAEEDGIVTQIPRYDIQLSAGHGAMNFEAERKEIPIPFAPDFLEKKLKRSSQEGLTIVEAAGDSMEPTIADGDLIMVDMCDQVKRAGIFGYEMGGETYVKRLEWTDYGLTILSDNPLYPMRAHAPDKLEEERFKLIGRVVWVGRVF